MCGIIKTQDCYIWGNFEILPKHLYKEYEICKKCAVRENGKRKKIDNNIKERTEKWLKKKQNH